MTTNSVEPREVDADQWIGRRVQDKTSVGETIQPPIEIAGSRRVGLADSGDEAAPGTEPDRVVEQLPIPWLLVQLQLPRGAAQVEVGRFGLSPAIKRRERLHGRALSLDNSLVGGSLLPCRRFVAVGRMQRVERGVNIRGPS